MVNTVPARTPLGASTTNRKWWFDVEDPANPGVPVAVFGTKEFKFKPSDATVVDDSDFDSEGYRSSTSTALAWGGEGKLARKSRASSATQYDPGQEIIRKAAAKMGVENRLKVRVYEMEPNGPRVEAYSGYVMATWSPDGGDMAALDIVSFTLVGQGKPIAIAHPEGVVALPLISAVMAGAPASDNEPFNIVGAYFDVTKVQGTDPAYVKVNGVNAPYEVLTSGLILATMPVGVAGLVPVVVGAGPAFIYTRAD